MGKIATEQYCASIGGGSGYTNNLCATKSRAQALGCSVSGSYANNQLVEESSLSSASIGISSFPILYVNKDFDQYLISTSIFTWENSHLIPILLRVVPKNYFGTNNWVLSCSRWLCIAEISSVLIDGDSSIEYSLNSSEMNSLYGSYNTGGKLVRDWSYNSSNKHYCFPNKNCVGQMINFNLNSGWPLKTESLHVYNNQSPMYGIAHANAYEGWSNLYIKNSNGCKCYPATLSEALIVMFNFNTINDILNSLYGTTRSNLLYRNYLTNTMGPNGCWYYTRPFTGDGGIRYIYCDNDFYVGYNGDTSGYLHPYLRSYNDFGILPIMSGDDFQLNCMSGVLDSVYG